MHTLIITTLTELLNQLSLEFTTISIDDSDESMIRINVESPQASRLIGWHGETIDAIQQLLKSIIRSKENMDRAPFLVLDVDGYRRAQEEKACKTADQKVDFVRRKRTRVALPPMSPYFRRIVHLHIARNPEYSDLETESVGEGDYRQIVIKLKEEGATDGELQPVIADENTEDGKGFENLDV